MIKSDHTPTQQKNKYGVNSIQTLSKYYNVKIISRECVRTSDLGMTQEWFTPILIQSLLAKGGPRKKEVKIKSCMLGQLFLHEPNSTKILMNEYLCASESCLNLEFSSCKKPVAITGEINNDYLEE